MPGLALGTHPAKLADVLCQLLLRINLLPLLLLLRVVRLALGGLAVSMAATMPPPSPRATTSATTGATATAPSTTAASSTTVGSQTALCVASEGGRQCMYACRQQQRQGKEQRPM